MNNFSHFKFFRGYTKYYLELKSYQLSIYLDFGNRIKITVFDDLNHSILTEITTILPPAFARHCAREVINKIIPNIRSSYMDREIRKRMYGNVIVSYFESQSQYFQEEGHEN